ncbi:SGNH/GDSL hydrolase family protein [Ruminococcus flavefaciens]|uniref:SGNH/GDSL hydrolase family protein n=1 Tax=Ruminococcus flavefaciens TaxID=1265 RepID=UPI000315FD6F|nr:GDSL-type esterase/lipase family protein [Ruminococcus flavefaciens]
MKSKYIYILKNPLMTFMLFITGIMCFSLTSSSKSSNDITVRKEFITAVNTASSALEESIPDIIITTTVTTTSTTTTTTVTTSKFEVCVPTVSCGSSPNSSFYHERLAIAGDSLALGFNVYGFIPDIHSISGESVSMWNLDYFTFDMGQGEMSMIDAIDYVHPRLLYISVGMNDVNLNYPEPYIKRYREVIDEIIRRMPYVNIVVAAITPVCSYCDIVRNDIIREYNSALEQMVKDMDYEQVVFFDAYSVVCDKNLDLREDYTSGDGMHLYIPCYTDILTALFDFLDTTDFKERLER